MDKSRKIAALLVVIFVWIAGSATAQIQDDPHGYYIDQPRVFYAGLIGGANFAQVDGDNFAGYHKVGFNAGGIAYAQVGHHVALSMEILYAQKGSKSNMVLRSKIDTAVYITKYGINLNYAEIPVMINYFDKRKSHFGAGFSYSRLIGATETITTVPAVNAHLDQYPFKNYDINAIVGVDLHLWQGLFLNIRFQYSVLPIRTNINHDFARAQQYNNLWALRLMYLLI